MKSLIVLGLLLVGSVVWGETYGYQMKVCTETQTCNLCGDTTSYNYYYYEGQLYINHVTMFPWITISARTNYVGFKKTSDKEYKYACPKCVDNIIEGLLSIQQSHSEKGIMMKDMLNVPNNPYSMPNYKYDPITGQLKGELK